MTSTCSWCKGKPVGKKKRKHLKHLLIVEEEMVKEKQNHSIHLLFVCVEGGCN